MIGRWHIALVGSRRIGASVLLALVLLGGCATVQPTPQSTVAATPVVDSKQTPALPPDDTGKSASTPIESHPVAPVEQVGLQEFAERNDDRMLQVQVGMSRQVVERLMGNLRSGVYANPFRQQAYAQTEGKQYEVLYYLTRAPRAGQGITESMLTPVIFRNNKIVAIGRYPLKKLRRGECPGKNSSC